MQRTLRAILRRALLVAPLLASLPAAAEETLADRVECLRQAMKGWLQFPVAFPSEATDHGNGAFTLHDVSLQTGEAAGPFGRILSLDVYAFDCAGFRANGAPSRLKLQASHIWVPPPVHPLVGILPGFAGPEDEFDLVIDLSYDATAKRVTLSQADLNLPNALSISFAADVSEVDLKGVQITSSGLMTLGGLAAMKGNLHWLDFTLWNKSGNRLLESFARGHGKSLLEQRDSWISQLDGMMEGEDNVPMVPVLRELKIFVQDLRKLHVRAKPPNGHVSMVMLGTAESKAEQLTLLGLKIEANR